MHKPEDFIHMPIPASMFTAVCAVLAGVSPNALTSSARTPAVGVGTADARLVTKSSSAQLGTPVESPASVENGSTATTDASPSDDGEIDADGWPWSADMHASTKGKTKDGLWRMKVGVTRPDPKPGFPVSDGVTSTTSDGAASAAPDTVTTGDAGPVTDTADDDEFAAFRAAADKASDTDTAAAASVPARKWTDSDLGSLCNQAATKLGDPAPIKAIIADFMPEGVVAHSRNIPDERREEFAQAVEAKAGIAFAG